jgi:hypothetical protein
MLPWLPCCCWDDDDDDDEVVAPLLFVALDDDCMTLCNDDPVGAEEGKRSYGVMATTIPAHRNSNTTKFT